ncbi:gamma-glutamylcyclotransferase [Rhodoblastus acidophilus]|uniref:Gamma-glutamylcyclotransferase n=1 Tax=Candidatus Rhodoblastus alkanivorans TaxID=2954117 RepID=A0ABS9Z641_9HYPH|nr:gamma-glutamylcyclotransferase family protein [Candidatus Rhodoblastus alkanivorans]MCI4678679.1 gamma-glutamylcyclotransferase [Candidatus Rhodoblastus alkanivorans]MCI4683088.1 gamma-glutamylcyclotransferase [Candidatus Rhodoblastus alkanivorans]MDI4640399.1 gamma-glutamylcyclotransferase [Rhodoblastus acidophilus]
MPLNFAYGSNMDAAAMARRCPGARALGRAFLPRHRFDLMPDGFATIVRDPAAMVAGVLWELGFGDLAALDRYEGVAQGAYLKISQPILREGASPIRALVYIGAPGKSLGRAPADYMRQIVVAARAQGLSSDYVDYLRRVGGEDVPEAPTKFRAIKNLSFL